MTFQNEKDAFFKKSIDSTVVRNITDAEGHYIVCGDVSYFPDDVKTSCKLCATPLVHRPHVPKNAAPICLPCAMIEDKAGGGLGEHILTPATIKELQDYLKSQKS